MQSRAESGQRLWTDVHKPPADATAGRRSTLKWFRAGKSRGRLEGFLVTWDVDSRDRAVCARLQRFIYGYSPTVNGRKYRYPGFVERKGVRYLGQSVLLVRADLLSVITSGLAAIGVEHDVDQASIG